MSYKAITIFTPAGAQPHITAEDDAFIHHSLLDGRSGILGGLRCTKQSNNSVRLAGGGVSNEGYILYIPQNESHELAVAAGTQSLGRHDLVVAEFTKGGGAEADSHVFKIIKGTASATPSDPELTVSDLLTQGSVRQLALFRIVIDGLELKAVERIAPSASAGDYICCKGSSGTVEASQTVAAKVPLTATAALNRGGSFEVANGGVKCLADGVAEVCGSVYMSGTPDASKFHGCYLMKNDTELTPGIRAAGMEGAVCAPSQLVSISAGDIITLGCRSTLADGVCLGGNTATWLSVRYI